MPSSTGFGLSHARQLSANSGRSCLEFIKAHQHRFSVQTMCRLLEVTRSGYCDRLKNLVSKRAQEDARLLRLIRASSVASQGVYGAPRVFLDLREAGETRSKHRVARLMRLNGLRALHGYRTNHLEPSMSCKGNCRDNAVAESFFSSLKKERIKTHIYTTRELAIADLSGYIESFYNPLRRHSHLGGMSPDQFEAAHKPRREVSTATWELQARTAR